MKMFPVYKEMNSYPYQKNGVPSSQRYYHPSWEDVPPQIKEDTSSSSCTHESWPHHYGYPVPMQCHNCCNHSQHPGYYNFRPPCSHFPPPPPPPYQHFYGGYPPYPQYYPMYYGPPPYYSMELPRYEYDKSVPRDQFHSCGCMNHPHNVKGGSNVKIEEHDPNSEKKKIESSSPARASNFPYPIMWIPPEYAMVKEQPRRLAENEGGQHVLPYVKKPQVQQRSIEMEAEENEGTKTGRKPHQNVQSTEQDPKVRYGWFPLDINKLKQLMEGGDAKQACDQENRSKDEKKAPDVKYKDDKQPSYSLFWMPCDEKEKGSVKGDVENTSSSKATDNPPYKVLPRKIDQADNEAEKQITAGVDNGRNGAMGADKKRIVKTIPVKQLDESAPNVSKKEEENKQDMAKNVTSKQSSSTTKKPKLPPICLRIDPPKKNKGNGSSRSPSPPGDKKRQDSDDSDRKRKPEQPLEGINIKDVEKKTHNQNQMEVLNGAEEDKKGSDILKDNAVNVEKNVVRQADSDQSDEVKNGDYRIEAQEQEAKENWQESKHERKVMSETEAAVAIQTACRGYNVRKSEPIKKLKQIEKVHEDAVQVKRYLEDLESHARVDVKEKTTMGETIMNLLLKLDTMQGLHQSIRDVRKSVAKELISLQEKLDSITSQQSIVLAQDTSLTSAVEGPLGSEVVIGSTGQPDKNSSLDGDENKKIAEEEIISSCDLSSSMTLPCQDGGSRHEISKTFDASLVNMKSQEGSSNNKMVSAATSDGDVAPASLDLKMKQELGACEAVQDKSATKFQELIADTSSVVDTTAQNHLDLSNQDEESELVSELPQEVDDIAEENVLLNANKNQEENLMSELPQDVNEELLANVSIIEDSEVENGMVAGNENHESDVLSELPRDVEEDEKDVKLTEQPCDAGSANENHESDVLSELPRDVEEDEKDVTLTEQPYEDEGSACKMKEVAQEDFPSKVTCDDGQVLTEVENSVVDHPTEKLEVENEDIIVAKNENYKLFELYSIETVSGQEGESITSSTSKETSEISSEVNVDDQNRSENVEQEPPVETLVPRLEQQSKEDDGLLGRSMEGQSSAAAHEMDEQVDQKIIEENEKLKAMLETLLAAGKEQQEVISNLNGKVKDLEKKLGSSKKKKSAKHPPKVRISRRLCGKPDNDFLRERTMGIAS